MLQLALLSNLRTLDLSCSKYVTTSQGALVHLSRLRHLAPAQPGLPACLGELTQLEVLAIKDCTYADHHHALLKNALPNLQCLTCLLLRIDGNGLPRLPSELAQLGRLSQSLTMLNLSNCSSITGRLWHLRGLPAHIRIARVANWGFGAASAERSPLTISPPLVPPLCR